MSTELRVRIVQDPSNGFRTLPDELTQGPDITVCLDVLAGDRIRARLYGPAVPSLYGTEHRVDLSVRPADVRAGAARLCRLWKELLVDHQPLTADGRPAPGGPERPYAALVDLRDRPTGELYDIVDELVLVGSELLFGTLLGGNDPRVVRFRDYLAEALAAREGLRVRFDSELHVPWPMVCLRPEDVPVTRPISGPDALFPLFLGHRHQIEQTGGAYPWLGGRREAPAVPTVSLNHDTRVDRKGLTRAAEVAAVLAKDTSFVERTTRAELVRALADGGLCEQLMYFWCHGHFVSNGSQPAILALKLTDQTTIDAQTVRERRRGFGEDSPFQPFVVLNACHAGIPEGGGDLAFLGRALIHAGARGVLGPQIEMPQVFAAEYALEFLSRYLRGAETAGSVAHTVARRFADELRNPLGFAYALHCGMDTRLERAALPTAETGQEVAV
ncbi:MULTISPECIES: CHAT domain-containing protein [unclassified Streptomyces]|uniref:CHAT domain-containing protein n=1 Tax=unclassified Streptomyces TaxID=2593676 RepID=UPI002E802731|nr:CHAT domain-containing protein [Streptomyces sp. NBC_00589]WTI36653.1 CHAT domain-containing protein [Streptomyces sp. NBC_00775]WUB29670.1 CHAT domain-containing protein [Streptomyces sp. NBC_00589]